jgi:hypothetical protein
MKLSHGFVQEMKMKVIEAKVKQGGELQFHICSLHRLFFLHQVHSPVEAGGWLFG